MGWSDRPQIQIDHVWSISNFDHTYWSNRLHRNVILRVCELTNLRYALYDDIKDFKAKNEKKNGITFSFLTKTLVLSINNIIYLTKCILGYFDNNCDPNRVWEALYLLFKVDSVNVNLPP